VVIIDDNLLDFLGLPIGGYGDLFALYSGLYATLDFGGNIEFFVGAGPCSVSRSTRSRKSLAFTPTLAWALACRTSSMRT
jgi:hypothetical protein